MLESTTSLVTPATVWSTLASICSQGGPPTSLLLSTASQLEGEEAREEEEEVAAVFFGRRWSRGTQNRIDTWNWIIFLSFCITWLSLHVRGKMTAKVCLYIISGHAQIFAPSERWNIRSSDVPADVTSPLTAVLHILSCDIHSRCHPQDKFTAANTVFELI